MCRHLNLNLFHLHVLTEIVDVIIKIILEHQPFRHQT